MHINITGNPSFGELAAFTDILTNINKYESPNESPPHTPFFFFSWADIFVSLIVVSPGNKLSGNPLPRPVAAKGRWSDFMARDWEMALCAEKC